METHVTEAGTDVDPKSVEVRVERSREAAKSAIGVIAATTPAVRPKGSPILALLEPYADEIRAAMARGWTAGAIARALHAKGVVFSEDAIRLRIAAEFRKGTEAQPEADPSDKRSDKLKRKTSDVVSGEMKRERKAAPPLPEARPGEMTQAQQIARIDDEL